MSGKMSGKQSLCEKYPQIIIFKEDHKTNRNFVMCDSSVIKDKNLLDRIMSMALTADRRKRSHELDLWAPKMKGRIFAKCLSSCKPSSLNILLQTLNERFTRFTKNPHSLDMDAAYNKMCLDFPRGKVTPHLNYETGKTVNKRLAHLVPTDTSDANSDWEQERFNC